ncbi:MAG: alkyl sulfatase C-terminal domain-containing protein, partial [Acidothermaceae bacterium]
PMRTGDLVATPEQCDTAIGQLAAHFGASHGHRADGLDRSVSAEITDLGLHYRGRLHDGVLDVKPTAETSDANSAGGSAQIRLTMTSDDLLALAAGNLSLGAAWLAGRVKVHASLPDMLRLRTML